MPGFNTRPRQLRRAQTDCERLLWLRLRNRQLAGAKFRRQSPIGAYVVDFICMESQLVVELDGGQHYEPHAIAYDLQRTSYLQRAGLKVFRFSNHEVLREMDNVMEQILRYLATPVGNLPNSALLRPER